MEVCKSKEGMGPLELWPGSKPTGGCWELNPGLVQSNKCSELQSPPSTPPESPSWDSPVRSISGLGHVQHPSVWCGLGSYAFVTIFVCFSLWHQLFLGHLSLFLLFYVNLRFVFRRARSSPSPRVTVLSFNGGFWLSVRLIMSIFLHNCFLVSPVLLSPPFPGWPCSLERRCVPSC